MIHACIYTYICRTQRPYASSSSPAVRCSGGKGSYRWPAGRNLIRITIVGIDVLYTYVYRKI